MRLPRTFRIALMASLTAGAALLWTVEPLEAQFQQYTPPGTVRADEQDLKEELEREVDEARWRLGPLRLQPQLTLRNAAYVNDVFVGSEEEVNDFTVSLGAGLHAYLPVGPKSTLVAFALPEYVWWQDLEDRRRWNESYGGGLFSYFNRLTFEVSARREERQGFPSVEVEQLVNTEQETAEARLAVRVARSLWIEGAGSATSYRFLTPEEKDDPRVAPFDRLDRDEDVFRGGLRLDLRAGWSVSGGVEHSEADFVDPTNDLSSSGTSPYVGLSRTESRTEVLAEAAFRSIDPEGDSRFRPFEEVTGVVQVLVHATSRLDLSVGHARELIYSVDTAFDYSLEDRSLLNLQQQLGRTRLKLYYEFGELDYTVGSVGGPDRIDDFTEWGALLDVDVWERISFEAGIEQSDYDSNLPGLDRDVTRYTLSLVFADTAWP